VREDASPRIAKRCRELVNILLPALREVARSHGYAIGLHGSVAYDIDLIVVPWRDKPIDLHTTIEALRKAIEAVVGFAEARHPEPTKKPCGRLAWSFYVAGSDCAPYFDISGFQPIAEQKESVG
jgi:hypothetical protein